jgi:hypothetical protein
MRRHTLNALAVLALALPGVSLAQDVEAEPTPPADPAPAEPAPADPAPAPPAPANPAPPAPTKASIAVIPFTYTAEVLARHRAGADA